MMVLLLSLLVLATIPVAAISLILLVINAFKKKSVKINLIMIVACIIIFFGGGSLIPEGEPTEEKKESIEATTETLAETTTEATTEVTTEEVTATEVTTEEVATTQESKEEEYQLTPLDELACEISLNTEIKDLKELAKKYNLYMDSRRTGTGNETYRIAMDKDVANTNKLEKGSVIELTYNLLNDDKLEKVDYFDAEKMTEVFLTSDGCTMLDYNKPESSNPFPVDSLSKFTEYIPKIPTDKNLLEELFCMVNDGTTKQEIMDYVDNNSLSYNPRGAGNEEIIAFGHKVQDKFGLNGTYIEIDFNDDKVSHLSYHNYPIEYKNGVYASFYSKDYPYSESEGFFITGNDQKSKMKNANDTINSLLELSH